MSSSSRNNRPKRSRASSSNASTSARAREKTEIVINVYDLLPPGKLSSVLWTIGGSLLHSGVVVRGKEYAYGGHNRKDTTGVYWTKPKFEPPGGTWRCSILQGFTFRSGKEIDAIIKEVSDADEFSGTNYNLLTNNCNHFTSTLCEKLTGRPAPGWLNRAASIGVALPCVVPKEWVTPPDCETADGELLEEDEEENEEASILAGDQRRRQREMRRSESRDRRAAEAGSSLAGGSRMFLREETPPPRLVAVKDTSGRDLPVAERAPVPIPKKSALPCV